VRELTQQLLLALGEDPTREGLRETPDRVSRWWSEFLDYQPGKLDTTFAHHNQTDSFVAVTGVRVWSLCEHHLMPFWCDLHMAYVPYERVLGLSKFARIAQQYAHRLQIQERMVEQIADAISEYSGSPNVMVIGSGVHLCMVMRGVRAEGTMTTSISRGAFQHDYTLRTEFLSLIK